MTKIKGAMTAKEFIEGVQNDKRYQDRLRENQNRNRLAQEISRAEDDLVVADLKEAGVNVGSVWDLVNTSGGYPTAIPIISSHLNRGYSLKYLDGLVRALTVPEARGIAWNDLDRLLHERKLELIEHGPHPLATILHALGLLCVERDLAGALAILGDRSFGKIRVALVDNLKLGRVSVESLLLAEKFEPDPEIKNEYEKFLRRLRNSKIDSAPSVKPKPA
jgi:hypothetical protein